MKHIKIDLSDEEYKFLATNKVISLKTWKNFFLMMCSDYQEDRVRMEEQLKMLEKERKQARIPYEMRELAEDEF